MRKQTCTSPAGINENDANVLFPFTEMELAQENILAAQVPPLHKTLAWQQLLNFLLPPPQQPSLSPSFPLSELGGIRSTYPIA